MELSKTTFSLLFFIRKDRVKKSTGKAPINCRITINGEIVNFNIHYDVDPNIWDAEANRARSKTEEALKLNQSLDNYQASIISKYREMLERDNSVTAEKVKNVFLGINKESYMLLDIFAKHNADVESLVGINKTKATLQKYKVTYTRLKDFMQFKYRISDINIKEIKYQFIIDFENYLRTQCFCSSNTTAKFMQFFKRIIILAKNNGWIVADPFANYKIRIEKVDRGYLTEEELKKMLKKQFEIKRLEQVRDIFQFSCYTGLAYIDVKNLTYANIIEGVDKNE